MVTSHNSTYPAAAAHVSVAVQTDVGVRAAPAQSNSSLPSVTDVVSLDSVFVRLNIGSRCLAKLGLVSGCVGA